MTGIVPHKEIIKCYCREGSAADAAMCLNKYYGTTYLAASMVEQIWAAELETNGVLRGLGPRPPNGYPRTDKTIVAEKLVAAA